VRCVKGRRLLQRISVLAVGFQGTPIDPSHGPRSGARDETRALVGSGSCYCRPRWEAGTVRGGEGKGIDVSGGVRRGRHNYH